MTSTPTTKVSFQNFTLLPVKEVVKSGSIGNAITVKTPHKGEVIIDYQTEERVGFIFTRIEKREKSVTDIAMRLQDLEQEAKIYLLKKWLKNSND